MEEPASIEKEDLNCSEFTEFSEQMLTQVSFWVEGFLSCSIAMAGFLGNVGSAVILSGKGIFQLVKNFEGFFVFLSHCATSIISHFFKNFC